jgi:ligand-binding sensor domain-containing protein
MKTKDLKSLIILLVAFGLCQINIVGWSQSEMKFEIIDQDKGLSTNSVSSILQGSKGFIWFGTRDGLNKYDGIKIKPIRFSNNYNIITSICESKTGNILVGTVGGGLVELNPISEDYRIYTLEDSKRYHDQLNIIVFVHEDLKGNIWIGDGLGGINQLKKGESKFKRYSDQILSINSSDRMTYFYEDSSGGIWVGTAHNGLLEFNHDTGAFDKIMLSDQSDLSEVRQILEDSDKNIWLATTNGLFLKTPNDTSFSIFIKEKSINTIWEDNNLDLWTSHDNLILKFNKESQTYDQKGITKGTHILPHIIDITPLVRNPGYLFHYSVNAKSVIVDEDNLFWMITANGIDKFDPSTGNTFEVRTENKFNNVSANEITSALLDQSKTLWFGTLGAGVNKYTQSRFLHYAHKPDIPYSLGNKIVLSIKELDDERIWIGSVNGGFDLFNRNTEQFERFHIAGSNSAIFDILPLKHHLLLATYGDGLVNYNLGTKEFTKYKHNPEDSLSIDSNNLQCIIQDSNNKLWVGSETGISIFEPKSKSFTKFNLVDADGNSIVNVFTIVEENDKLWIGTLGQGLFCLDTKTKSFKNFKNRGDSLSNINNNYITSIHIDREDDNLIWLGTYGGGINLFNKRSGSFQNFGSNSGLKNQVIYGILEDDKQNIWFSSNAGLAIFDKKTQYVKSQYEVNDGLQSNEFNRGSYCLFSDGNMAFGGINGLNIFDPSKQISNHFEPNLVITSFKIFTKTNTDILAKICNEGGSIILPFDQNFISIDFTVLDFRNTDRNRYSYRLKGLIDDWTDVNNERPFANFTGLNPGSYIFELKATTSKGVWLSSPISIPIVIEPPFWQTWSFRAVILFLIISIVLLLHNLKVKNLKRQKGILNELVEKRTYTIQAQNEEITTQNEEITAQNEEIMAMNDQLELKVSERTISLEESNKRLIEYAYNNAHMIRGPLARLLGLTYISKISKSHKKKDIKILINKIEESGNELDSVIRELGKKLTNETGINPFKDINEE